MKTLFKFLLFSTLLLLGTSCTRTTPRSVATVSGVTVKRVPTTSTMKRPVATRKRALPGSFSTSTVTRPEDSCTVRCVASQARIHAFKSGSPKSPGISRAQPVASGHVRAMVRTTYTRNAKRAEPAQAPDQRTGG